jgi:predicted PurR-regulated permease PerM
MEIELGDVHADLTGIGCSTPRCQIPPQVARTVHVNPAVVLMRRMAMKDQDKRTVLEPARDDADLVVKPPSESDPEAEPIVIRMPVDVRSVALSVIAAVGLILFLQYAQAVLIPIVLSALIFYVLDPVVDRLESWRVPRALGAALVLLTLVSGLGYTLYTLRDDALAVVEELPEAAQRARATLRSQRTREEGPIDKLQEAAKEIDKAAAEATGPPTRDPAGIQRVQVVQPFRAIDYLMWGSAGALALGAQGVMILFLSYFLLVADDLYKRKLVKIAPTLSKKKVTVQIVDEIGKLMERFMFVQVLTSLIVAVATSLALWWVGLDQPVIWGLAAGILNSIPYFGPIVVSGGLTLVAYLQFGTIEMALYVAIIAMVITTLEGWLITPALMGRAASINPAAIFIGIIFWSWVWGVWGLILAVPMLMMLKAICDRIEELQPIGELLGE